MIIATATIDRPKRWAGCTQKRFGLTAFAVTYLICELSFIGTSEVQAQAVVGHRREYNVKAVFLYSFGRYVTWPASTFEQTDGDFVIGILGEDPFSGAIDQIAAKRKVDGRKIAIRRFENLDAYQPCQLLFVSRSLTAEEQKQVLDNLSRSGVLIVGETDGFAKEGGAVNFVVTGTKVQFEINTRAAILSGLALDAKFMALRKECRLAPGDTGAATTICLLFALPVRMRARPIEVAVMENEKTARTSMYTLACARVEDASVP